MESGSELPSLMARYGAGDSVAASAMVVQLSPQLRRFFLLEPMSRSHADDLLQETWLRIHRVRHTYRPGEPVQAWIYAIARNVRTDHLRKSYRIRSREESIGERDEIPAAAAGRTASDSDLESLLAPLPESQREVVFLLKICGLSLEEVARATSSSVGSVKQKAHRAYETLRKALTGKEVGHAGQRDR